MLALSQPIPDQREAQGDIKYNSHSTVGICNCILIPFQH